MKANAIVKTKAESGAEYTTFEIPEMEPKDVLVKVKACAICGTDVHIYDWNDWAKSRIKTPHIMGHEFCGDVVEVGDQVKNLRVGHYISDFTKNIRKINFFISKVCIIYQN